MANPGPGYRAHPEHTITITPHAGRVTVTANGITIANSTDAVVLQEASYPPVFYVPKRDVRMDLLAPTEKHSRCPFKGQASYWTIQAGERAIENSVWGYPEPYDEVLAIQDKVAFYPDKVTIEG